MHESKFFAWKASFCGRADIKVLPANVIQHFQENAKLNIEVLERYQSQPEISLPTGRYVQRLLTDSRLQLGREEIALHRTSLKKVEDVFGVDGHILAAIWGIETQYGRVRGEIPTLDALSTLSSNGGKRQGFWQHELIAALQIIATILKRPKELMGSWAGAMGHTQFMPTSYLSDATTLTGDGEADIWGSNPTDSLASAANFLARRGWQSRLPWGDLALLPNSFDYTLSGNWNTWSAAHWRETGVTLGSRRSFKNWGKCSLIIPDGHRGPAFLVTANFRVLLKYNLSISYALAVGLLANALQDRNFEIPNWPENGVSLSRDDICLMQQLLVQRGLDTQGVDGLAGPATLRAVQSTQAEMGDIADGLPSQEFLQKLQNLS